MTNILGVARCTPNSLCHGFPRLNDSKGNIVRYNFTRDESSSNDRKCCVYFKSKTHVLQTFLIILFYRLFLFFQYPLPTYPFFFASAYGSRSSVQGIDKDIMTLPTTNPRRHAYKPILNQSTLSSSSATTSLATLAVVKSAIRRNLYFIIFTIFVFFITLYICLTVSYKDPPRIPYYTPLLPLERRPIQPPLRRPYSKTPSWIGSWLGDRKLSQGDAQQLAEGLHFDLVYTWVNGSDPSLARMKKKYQDLSTIFNPPPVNQSATTTIKGRMDWLMKDNRKYKDRSQKVDTEAINRYRDMNELQYSVRSVAENASPGLIHRIHILTTSVPDDFDEKSTIGQVPAWLDQRPGQETIRLVEHKNIYDNISVLPSFNSLSIESQMHHIPELSEIVCTNHEAKKCSFICFLLTRTAKVHPANTNTTTKINQRQQTNKHKEFEHTYIPCKHNG